MRSSYLLLMLLMVPAVCDARVWGRDDEFVYTMRREIRAVDPKTGAEIPLSEQKDGGDDRRTLGVTGRVAISRRAAMVEDGGQLFVHATVPESLAGEPHVLDVLVEGKDGMNVRGSIRYEPSGPRRVSRLFVFPDLEPGPTMVEIHVRGVHVSDWQEIVTEEVEIPVDGRLHFAYSLEGAGGKSSLDLSVEARPSKGAGRVSLLSTRVSAGDRKWREETRTLEDLAGQRVRFAFRSRPEGGASAAAPGVVWGAPVLEVDEKRSAYPVIVVVSLDSLRTSAVGLYSGGNATPFLDSFFARKGAVMMRAVTQSVTTLPAHLTLLTGLGPVGHGVVDERKSLGQGVVTLAEALRDKGWHTAAFTEGGALAGELGFRRGFDVYDEGESAEIDPGGADALSRARNWLDEYSGKPLLLFVHTYATRPVHGGLDATTDPEVREKQLEKYVDQVRETDREVKKLFEAMKGRIDEGNALYVVTSGHGEEFFEHGAAGHGTQLYDETMRVPLLVRGSRIAETGKHDVSVGLVDVAPTILELARVRIPSGMQGRSVAPLLESGDDVMTAARFSEARRPVRLTSDGKLLLWGPPSYAMRDGTKKVIWNAGAGSYEAYDLASDPRERNNLVTKNYSPAWARSMAKSLKTYPVAAGRSVKPGRKAELSPENRSRLESLGYAR